MHLPTRLAALAAIAFTLGGAAIAQTPASPPAPAVDKPADPFIALDADKSGSLTLSEVKAANAAVNQADFDKYDADKSKSLSKPEFDKWVLAMKAAKPANAGQPG